MQKFPRVQGCAHQDVRGLDRVYPSKTPRPRSNERPRFRPTRLTTSGRNSDERCPNIWIPVCPHKSGLLHPPQSPPATTSRPGASDKSNGNTAGDTGPATEAGRPARVAMRLAAPPRHVAVNLVSGLSSS